MGNENSHSESSDPRNNRQRTKYTDNNKRRDKNSGFHDSSTNSTHPVDSRSQSFDVPKEELLETVRNLQEELERIKARQTSEDENKKNRQPSPTQAVQNGADGGLGYSPGHAQSYHGQPLLQSPPAGHHIGPGVGQPAMGQLVGQPGQMGSSMMGGFQSHPAMEPPRQMSQSMMGGPIGQPMLNTQGASMSHSMMAPQFGHGGPMGPHPGFVPQPNMPHPEFNPRFQPPIGRMGPQIPQNHGGFTPYGRAPQNNTAQNSKAQHNQGVPQPHQKQRHSNQTKDQPRARSASRENNGPQKKSNNPYRQNKKDEANNKNPQKPSTANQGAVPKQKPPQPNGPSQTKQHPRGDSASNKTNPSKTWKPKQEQHKADKLEENAVPKNKKEKNPLFSNKASNTFQNLCDPEKSSRTQKPGKVVDDIDLSRLSSRNPVHWDKTTLAQLFAKCDDSTIQQLAKPNPTPSGTSSTVDISELAQMFEPDEDPTPVLQPTTSDPPSGSRNAVQSQPKEGPCSNKFNTDDLRNILENLNLLSSNESKPPVDLRMMIEKIQLPPNAELNDSVPKSRPDPGHGSQSNNPFRDAGPKKFSVEELKAFMDKLNIQAKAPSKNAGSEPSAPKNPNKKPRQRGFKKKQGQNKKQIVQSSDDSDDSSNGSSLDELEEPGDGKKPFLKHLTPGELPPLSKTNAGVNGFLKHFIDKTIPTKREAYALGIKTAQMYRKVQGVIVSDGIDSLRPKTVMDIIKFGEDHPTARATFFN